MNSTPAATDEATAPSVSAEDIELIDALSDEVEELLTGVEERIQQLRAYVFGLPFDTADYVAFLTTRDVPAYLEAMRGVNRFVHTIKGNAGFMNLEKLKTYCHRVEELTVGIMAGALYLDRAGYAIIEQIPNVIGRFFAVLGEAYTDIGVSIETELSEIEQVREQVSAAVAGKGLDLATFQKEDLGAVRTSAKVLRVSMELAKVDQLVGDYQTAVHTVMEMFEALGAGTEQTGEVARTLNEHLENLLTAAQDRMVLTRYQRIVCDLSKALGKNIEFNVTRNSAQGRPDMWDHCHNAMVHLVRNAVDHGIESPEERAAAGKPPGGCIDLDLHEDHKSVYIELTDDGRGIDPVKISRIALERGAATAGELQSMGVEEIQKLIFRAGFTTQQQATDISGRGVGMDAVLKEIEGNLGGKLALRSEPGVGTTIRIEIPKSETLAECVLFGDAAQVYAIPKVQDISYLDCDPRYLESVMGRTTIYTGAQRAFPVLPIMAYIDPERYDGGDLKGYTIIRLGADDQVFGLAVPNVFGHQRMKIERHKGWSLLTGPSKLVYGFGPTNPVTVVLDVEELANLVLAAPSTACT